MVLFIVTFIPSREAIEVTIVDQGVVAIAPGETLCSDAKVIIGDEWRSLVLRAIRHAEGVDVALHQ